MTDDSLIHCSLSEFDHLFASIADNKFSSLTLIDLSRNFISLDNVEEIHNELINALMNQSRVNEEESDDEDVSTPGRKSMLSIKSRKSRLSSIKKSTKKKDRRPINDKPDYSVPVNNG